MLDEFPQYETGAASKINDDSRSGYLYSLQNGLDIRCGNRRIGKIAAVKLLPACPVYNGLYINR